MNFNEKIQKLRKQHNLTQEQQYKNWKVESGIILKDITKLFNISIDKLLSSDEKRSIAQKENYDILKKLI